MPRLIDADERPIRSIDTTDLPKDGKGLLVILKEDIDNAPTVNKCDNCDLMFLEKTRGNNNENT